MYQNDFQSWGDNRYQRRQVPMPPVGSPFELIPAALVVSLSGAVLAGALILPIARALMKAISGNVLGAGVGLARWFLWRRLLLEARILWNTEGRSLVRRARAGRR